MLVPEKGGGTIRVSHPSYPFLPSLPSSLILGAAQQGVGDDAGRGDGNVPPFVGLWVGGGHGCKEEVVKENGGERRREGSKEGKE